MVRAFLRTDLEDHNFQAVYSYLLKNTTDGKLQNGALRDASVKFARVFRLLGRIRSKSQAVRDRISVICSLKKQWKEKVGRPKRNVDTIHQKVRECLHRFRGTLIADLCNKLSYCQALSGSQMRRHRKWKPNNRTSSNHSNRICRAKWCLSHFNILEPNFFYSNTYHQVQIETVSKHKESIGGEKTNRSIFLERR